MATDMGKFQKRISSSSPLFEKEMHLKGIHDRFLKDPDFRTAMLGHDRDEETCIKNERVCGQEIFP